MDKHVKGVKLHTPNKQYLKENMLKELNCTHLINSTSRTILTMDKIPQEEEEEQQQQQQL